MKKSFLYFGLALLIMSSCKEVQKGEKDEAVKAVEPVTIDCNKPDKRVYPQTAWIWAESWVSAYNYLYPNDTVSVAPEVFFERSTLDKLKIKSEDATGVRIYYILRKETDKIPSLAIVNTFNCDNIQCKDKTDTCVLVHWVVDAPLNTPNPNFITYESFEGYQLNWQNADKERTGYIPVNAYNYSWSTIENLYSAPDLEGIRVKYGARTVELSEEGEFGGERDPVPGQLPISGSIVACNVLMSWDEHVTFEDALNGLQEDGEGLDFAMPCPQYCGEE